VADIQVPWVCAALAYADDRPRRPFPEALALVHRMAARKAKDESLPAGTRLRVKVTRTPVGGLWLDGEPLPPKVTTPTCRLCLSPAMFAHTRTAGCDPDGWGPPPAGAPCTCDPATPHIWDEGCPQHGVSPALTTCPACRGEALAHRSPCTYLSPY